MTGPEHYRRAADLIAYVDTGHQHDDGSPIVFDEPDVIAAAQVHATLALAAAVGGLDAYSGPISGYATGRLDSHAWRVVGAVKPDSVRASP